MKRKTIWAAVLFSGVIAGVRAEIRLFRNTDKTKSFSAELTAYDANAKRVGVRLDNGRIQSFTLDVLSQEDQAYVLENAKRLAVGNDLIVTLNSYQEKSTKSEKGLTSDRIYQSGYTIKLTNRAKTTIENLKVNYTVYYAVQGYLDPQRTPAEKSGTLEYKGIPPGSSVPQTTDPVEIVSGKLEPTFENVAMEAADGSKYYERVLRTPGGTRKDLLVGCRVDVLVDGKVVKSVSEGKLPDAKPK